MRLPHLLLPFFLLVSPALADDPILVDSVVAVVGRKPILLSEVRERVRPFLTQAKTQGKESEGPELMRQMVQRMIDDELEAREAQRLYITVLPAEIDAALKQVAEMNKLTPEQILAEALRSGLTEEAYRKELHRQLLEGKLLNVTARSQMRVTDSDLEALYLKSLRVARRTVPYRAAWIVLRPASGAASQAKKTLASDLLRRAREGEDFAALARSHSDDTSTKAKGGDLGQRTIEGQGLRLAPELEEKTLELDVGEVSDVIVTQDSLVILKLVSRPPLSVPTFESVRDALSQQVYSLKLEEARKKWLEELRNAVYVEVRL